MHNEEFHDLYPSLNIIRVIKSRRLRWVGHMAHMGEKSNAYRVLVGKPERKRPLLRYRCRWKDNIKMYLTVKDGTAGTGFIWLRIGTSNRLLRIQ